MTLIILVAHGRPAPAAETSQTIAFRGCDASLTDTANLRLRLFDAAAGGNLVFEETQTGVAVDPATNCVSVPIGNGAPLAAALFMANPSLWVAFALDSAPDTELGGGRTPLTANGYAFRAQQATSADQLGGVPASGYLATSGGSLSGSSAAAIVSVTNTGSGSALTAASQSAQGVAGLFQNSAGGDLLRGQDAGTATVFRLFNDGGAYFSGDVGIGIAPSAGTKLDVNGDTLIRTSGSGGNIQFGTPGAETGMTVVGANRADVKFDGSTLKLLAGAGRGIPASTSGVAITTAGNVGIGTTTPVAKLHTIVNATYGTGVLGSAPLSGTGVQGVAGGGPSAIGVSGAATGGNGTGVYGQGNPAVHGFPSTLNGYAGFFSGTVRVNGTLSKSGGSFKIDHPLDPANK